MSEANLRTLRVLQAEWIKTWDKLAEYGSLDQNKFAAPFLSIEPEGYRNFKGTKILFIGQATMGDFYLDKFLNAAKIFGSNRFESRVAERLDRSREFFTWQAKGNYSSDFWRLGNELSIIGSNELPTKNSNMMNLVWSNIAKIGVKKGNPKGKYLDFQIDLAIETLFAEISYYSPDLIYIAHGVFGAVIVNKIFDHNDWEKPREDFWFKRRSSGHPAVVASDHPGRKRKNDISEWLKITRSLI